MGNRNVTTNINESPSRAPQEALGLVRPTQEELFALRQILQKHVGAGRLWIESDDLIQLIASFGVELWSEVDVELIHDWLCASGTGKIPIEVLPRIVLTSLELVTNEGKRHIVRYFRAFAHQCVVNLEPSEVRLQSVENDEGGLAVYISTTIGGELYDCTLNEEDFVSRISMILSEEVIESVREVLENVMVCYEANDTIFDANDCLLRALEPALSRTPLVGRGLFKFVRQSTQVRDPLSLTLRSFELKKKAGESTIPALAEIFSELSDLNATMGSQKNNDHEKDDGETDAE